MRFSRLTITCVAPIAILAGLAAAPAGNRLLSLKGHGLAGC